MVSFTSPSIPPADGRSSPDLDLRRAEALEVAERRLAEDLGRLRATAIDVHDQAASWPAVIQLRDWRSGGFGAISPSSSGAVDLLARGQASSAELVEAALDRIARLDDELKAWVTVDLAGARAAAAESDLRSSRGERRSRIDGVPVGIKDLIDTRGLRTTYGSPIFRDHVPERDAHVVSLLRQAGAVIVGKTVTTEFATYDPGPTHNPWNERHTPGGSSSGSAAAVASGMVPVAFGTQTGGSTIRPASYCGIVGYIPTPGWIGRSGIFPCSWTLDRVGAFGGSVADVALFLEACVAADDGEPATQLRGTQGSAVPLPRGPIGVVEHLVERASPAMRRAVGSVADFLDRAGTPVETVALEDLDTAHAAHFVIMRTEIAAAHSELYDRHASLYGPQIAALVETGRLVTATDYLHALRLRRRYQAKWAQLLDRFEVLLLPGAVGEAEPTLETIGDPEMNLFATFGGLPAITVPAGIGDSGMPVGIQLVAGPSHDAELLRAAAEAEARIAFRRPELPEVASFRASGSTRTGT